MPTTPTLHLRYPSGTSAVDVVTDVQNLATDVDTALGGTAVTFNSLGSAGVTTSSTTYVDITGASLSWTKIGSAAGSDVLVEVSLSGFSSATSTTMMAGVRINGTDYDATQYTFNATSDHRAFPTGRVRISGVPAGTYTVQLRVKRTSGAGGFTADSGDTVSFRVEEKPL